MANGHHFEVETKNPLHAFMPPEDVYGALCIAPQNIMQVWPHVREFIDRGYRASGEIMDESFVLSNLVNCFMLLWVAHKNHELIAAMTTRLIRTPDGLVCYILAVGGSGLKYWLPMQPQLEKYARDQNCVKIRCQGRAGWERALPDFTRVGVVLEKRL